MKASNSYIGNQEPSQACAYVAARRRKWLNKTSRGAIAMFGSGAVRDWKHDNNMTKIKVHTVTPLSI